MIQTVVWMILLLSSVLVAQTERPSLRVSMISLGVQDLARSEKFYRETLGLEFLMESEPGQVALFRAGEVTIALNHPLAQASDAVVGAVEVIFNVNSVEVAYRSLVSRGCPFVRTPREVFSGTWAATFTDPDGHRLTILGPQ